MQLEEEQAIKNASIWAMKEYYANYSLLINNTEATPPPMDPADVIRGPCWETAVGIVTQIKQIYFLMTYEGVYMVVFAYVGRTENDVFNQSSKRSCFILSHLLSQATTQLF